MDSGTEFWTLTTAPFSIKSLRQLSTCDGLSNSTSKSLWMGHSFRPVWTSINAPAPRRDRTMPSLAILHARCRGVSPLFVIWKWSGQKMRKENTKSTASRNTTTLPISPSRWHWHDYSPRGWHISHSRAATSRAWWSRSPWNVNSIKSREKERRKIFNATSKPAQQIKP